MFRLNEDLRVVVPTLCLQNRLVCLKERAGGEAPSELGART